MITIELDKEQANILLMLFRGVKLNSQEQRELFSVEAQIEAGLDNADN